MQTPNSTIAPSESGRRLSLTEARPSQGPETSLPVRLSPGRRGSAGDEGETLAEFKSPVGTPGRSDFVSPLPANSASPFAAYVRTPMRASNPDSPASASTGLRQAAAPADNGNSSNTSVAQDRKEKSPQKWKEGAGTKLRRHSSPHRKNGASPPPGKLPASPLAAMGDRSLLSPNSAHRLREEQKAREKALDPSSDSSDFSEDSRENSPIGKLVRTTRGVFQPGLGLLVESPANDSARQTRRHTAPTNARHVRAETGSGPDSPTVIFSECAGLIRALSFVPKLQIQSVAIAINEFVKALVDAQPERGHLATKYEALRLTLVATAATNNTGVSFFLSQLKGAIQYMPDFRRCSEVELESVSYSRADLTKRALDFGKQVIEQSRKN